MSYKDDDNVKFDGKYGRVPDGYDLECFDGDYGIVKNENWTRLNRRCRLINSKGEFVTGECVEIYPIENNCYVYWDEHESGVIDNGEIKKIAGGSILNSRLPFGIIENDLFRHSYRIVNKDNEVIVLGVCANNIKYSDGKAFYIRPAENDRTRFALSVASKTVEDILIIDPDLCPQVVDCKDGNCLITTTDEDLKTKFYGINLQKGEVTVIDGNDKLTTYEGVYEGKVSDYYAFKNDKGEVNIYNSDFELVKNGIFKIADCMCKIGDEYYYMFWDFNRSDTANCVSLWDIEDFDGNIIFEHVKRLKDGVLQIGDDKIYDSVNEKWNNLPAGWKILSWNKDVKNNNLLVSCFDDYGNVHLTDFDTFNINLGDKVPIGYEIAVFENKYVAIDDYIIPVADLKTIGGDCECTFGTSTEKPSDSTTIKERYELARKPVKAILKSDKCHDIAIKSVARRIASEHYAKEKPLVKKNTK